MLAGANILKGRIRTTNYPEKYFFKKKKNPEVLSGCIYY